MIKSFQNDRHRSALQSSNDLMTLVNRVNILEHEKQKSQKRNILTLQKTKRILAIRQNSVLEHNKLINEQLIQKDIKLRKHNMISSQYRESQQKITLNHKSQEKTDQNLLIKEELLQSQLVHNQQQREFIKQQNHCQKAKVQKFWHDKLLQYSKEKQFEKMLQDQKCKHQDQSILQLEKLELNIIEELQKSQQVNTVLVKQLEDAQTLSQDRFLQAYPDVSGQQLAQMEKTSRKPIKSRYLYAANYNKFPENLKLPVLNKGKNSVSQHGDLSNYQSYNNSKLTLIKIYSSNDILSYRKQSQQDFTDRSNNGLVNNRHVQGQVKKLHKLQNVRVDNTNMVLYILQQSIRIQILSLRNMNKSSIYQMRIINGSKVKQISLKNRFNKKP